MRDLRADWKLWSRAERVVAVLLAISLPGATIGVTLLLAGG
jgi:hypothetical protein